MKLSRSSGMIYSEDYVGGKKRKDAGLCRRSIPGVKEEQSAGLSARKGEASALRITSVRRASL